MDDLPSILQDNYGLRPQGKSAPMSSVKKTPPSSTSSRSGGNGGASRLANKSPPSYGTDAGRGFGGGTFKASSSGSGSPYTEDVFGGPSVMGRSPSPFSGDDIFGGSTKTGSQPLDLGDDIFGPPRKSTSSSGLPGTAATSSDPFGSDDIFGVGKSSGGTTGSSLNTSGSGGKTFSASASAFDDLLDSGGFDASAKPKSKSRSRASATSAGDDLLGGFSAESGSLSTKKKGEQSAATQPTRAADPFAGVDVDPLFGGPAPPPSSGSGFTDPFDPFFVPPNPSNADPPAASAPSSSGNEGLADLDTFAKFAGSTVKEESPADRKGRSSREIPEKTEKPKATSNRSSHGHSQNASSSGQEHEQEAHAAPKVAKSSSSSGSGSSRDGRRVAAQEAQGGTASAPHGNSRSSKNGQNDAWLTLDDIILKTKPVPAPPPKRPPPPIGSQTAATPTAKPSSSRSEHSPELPRGRSESSRPERSERKVDRKVEPEVEPQPPSGSSRFAHRRPSHPSGEQAPRSHDVSSGGRSGQFNESAFKGVPDRSSGGLDGLEDFASGGRHRRRPSESKQPTPAPASGHQEAGPGLDGLDEFASGGGARRRQAGPETKGPSPRKDRSERRRESPSEPAGRSASAHDMNDSAEAAEQSAAAMKEVLERAKLKAEAARRAREQERERERQEMEAAREASNRAKAKVAEAQAEARAKAEAEARAQAQAQAHRHAPPDDLDAFFGGSAAPARTQSEPRQRQSDKGPSNLEESGSSKRRQPEPVKRTPSAPPPASAEGWADILGGADVQVPTPNGAPLPGESEERRKLRLERERRTNERAAEALREKNRRDADAAREQVERERAGESLDLEIKKWAAGKQGNIRALLSTLQYVLWPECKWEPVPLTDLMSGAAVKKAYRKATLCVHPDKVQQKGATIQQRYIAEKVFDLLKEAWNKFNSEELF